MPARKIVDEGEVRRWYEEGRTLAWMVSEYQRKYQIEVRASAFGNLRARRGWDRRLARDERLIPWHVLKEHRWDYAVMMLRAEARRRAGLPSENPQLAGQLDAWIAGLRRRDEVVAYDEQTGFAYVPRRPNIDRDLIREPDRRTTLKLPR